MEYCQEHPERVASYRLYGDNWEKAVCRECAFNYIRNGNNCLIEGVNIKDERRKFYEQKGEDNGNCIQNSE